MAKNSVDLTFVVNGNEKTVTATNPAEIAFLRSVLNTANSKIETQAFLTEISGSLKFFMESAIANSAESCTIYDNENDAGVNIDIAVLLGKIEHAQKFAELFATWESGIVNFSKNPKETQGKGRKQTDKVQIANSLFGG